MADGFHEKLVDASIEKVWEIVSDLEKWAALVPGYMEHTIISDAESEWKFKVDAGLFKKKIHAKVEIKEWVKPNKVSFTLTGLNEKFTGSGSFEASRLTTHETVVRGRLSIKPDSSMGKLITPIIERMVPDMTRELTNNVSDEIERLYSHNL
ncbi:CoxG family protein [Lysinibacillus sphaericus]